MAQRMVIEVRGGCITGILADAEVEVTVVDWDSLDYDTSTESDERPELPRGLHYDHDTISVTAKPWVDIPF